MGGFWLQFSTGIDDAHITYFASHILASQNELLNYNLERVEQSSSLLHVMLSALLTKITGMSAVASGHAVPLLAGLLCLALLNVHTARLGQQPWPAMLCASASAFVYWNFAGLEAPLAAMLMLAYVLSLAQSLQNLQWKSMLAIAISGAGLQMTRPEMVLFVPALTLAVSAFMLLQKKIQPKTTLIICAIALVIAATISLWRHWYFGAWFPQPVTAKANGITLAAIHNGVRYVLQTVSQPWAALPVLIGIFSSLHIVWRSRQQPVSAALISMSIAIIGYSALIVLMGGDWMPAGRLWVTIIPLTAITISYSLCTLLPARPFTAAMIFITSLNMAGIATQAYSQTALTDNVAAGDKAEMALRYNFFELHSQDNRANLSTLEFLIPLMSQVLQQQPAGITIMSGQMGMIPYHLSLQYPGKIRFTDRNALIDRKLTDCPLTRDLPRAQQGLDGLSTAFFLKKSDLLLQQCNIHPADVIFDLWWHHLIPETTEMLAKRGYRVIFIQQGHMSPLQDQLVAIRTELWEAIESPQTVSLLPKDSPIAH